MRMGDMLPVDVLSRWIHVGTAIVVVGGTVFLRLVLMPAAARLSDEAHETLRGHLMRTWKFFVHIGIVLFLVSGFYNYIAVSIPRHKGASDAGFYHGLIGTKILLAFVVFFLAEALVGRSAAFEGMRHNRKTWLGVIILLAAAIVCISGFLKVYPWAPPGSGG
jgi:uncharacterized membrane protein